MRKQIGSSCGSAKSNFEPGIIPCGCWKVNGERTRPIIEPDKITCEQPQRVLQPRYAIIRKAKNSHAKTGKKQLRYRAGLAICDRRNVDSASMGMEFNECRAQSATHWRSSKHLDRSEPTTSDFPSHTNIPFSSPEIFFLLGILPSVSASRATADRTNPA